MEAYVYLITCTATGKKYVGSTTMTITNRYCNHVWSSKKGRHYHLPLYADMREHGIGAFTIEVLETVPKGKHREREQHWINELDTCENGYNTRWAITKQPFKDYHREWSARRVVCECGREIAWGSKTKHQKSLDHQKRLANLSSSASVPTEQPVLLAETVA